MIDSVQLTEQLLSPISSIVVALQDGSDGAASCLLPPIPPRPTSVCCAKVPMERAQFNDELWGVLRTPNPRASLIVIIGAFLSSAVGCTTHCAGMAPTTSPSGGPPRELLTFARNSPLVGSGYKLVLFDDGCLEYQGLGRQNPGHADMFVERPAIARVRANLERLSALRPDCCNCSGAADDSWRVFDRSWTFMTFQVPGGAELGAPAVLIGVQTPRVSPAHER